MLVAALVSPSWGGTVVRDEHWEIRSSGDEAEARDWLALLEAAWPQFAEFFGGVPKQQDPLVVRVFDTKDDMNTAIAAAGGEPPDAGGYYCPVAKHAYASRQPSPWYTRTLILHEAAHAFHHWAVAGNGTEITSWYGEGVVEHLSHHTWDGETLHLGVVPLLSLERRAGKALDAAKAADYDPATLLDDDHGVSRPECMHIVRYLLADPRHAKRFATLAKKLDRGGLLSDKQFRKAFGARQKFVPAYRAWLETVQEPWELLWIDWDARAADALRGTATAIGLCRRKATTRRLAVHVQPIGTGSWRAGVLLHWNGPQDFTIGVVKDGDKVQVQRRVGTDWKSLHEGRAPADTDGWDIAAAREAAAVTFTVNGDVIGTFDLPDGSMGLAVDHATVDFTAIRAE